MLTVFLILNHWIWLDYGSIFAIIKIKKTVVKIIKFFNEGRCDQSFFKLIFLPKNQKI